MNESFYTGKGIGVAILDTGIYPHIDFDSRICAFADFILNKNSTIASDAQYDLTDKMIQKVNAMK